MTAQQDPRGSPTCLCNKDSGRHLRSIAAERFGALWTVLVICQHGAGCTCQELQYGEMPLCTGYPKELWHSRTYSGFTPTRSDHCGIRPALHAHARWGWHKSAPAGRHYVMHAVTAQARPASPVDLTRTWRPGSHGSAA
jgi:hypothetical protein